MGGWNACGRAQGWKEGLERAVVTCSRARESTAGWDGGQRRRSFDDDNDVYPTPPSPRPSLVRNVSQEHLIAALGSILRAETRTVKIPLETGELVEQRPSRIPTLNSWPLDPPRGPLLASLVSL